MNVALKPHLTDLGVGGEGETVPVWLHQGLFLSLVDVSNKPLKMDMMSLSVI